MHVPLGLRDRLVPRLEVVYGTIAKLLDDQTEKLFVHHEEFGDRLLGVMGGYLLYSGLVDKGTCDLDHPKLTGHQHQFPSAARSSPPPSTSTSTAS